MAHLLLFYRSNVKKPAVDVGTDLVSAIKGSEQLSRLDELIACGDLFAAMDMLDDLRSTLPEHIAGKYAAEIVKGKIASQMKSRTDPIPLSVSGLAGNYGISHLIGELYYQVHGVVHSACSPRH